MYSKLVLGDTVLLSLVSLNALIHTLLLTTFPAVWLVPPKYANTLAYRESHFYWEHSWISVTTMTSNSPLFDKSCVNSSAYNCVMFSCFNKALPACTFAEAWECLDDHQWGIRCGAYCHYCIYIRRPWWLRVYQFVLPAHTHNACCGSVWLTNYSELKKDISHSPLHLKPTSPSHYWLQVIMIYKN